MSLSAACQARASSTVSARVDALASAALIWCWLKQAPDSGMSSSDVARKAGFDRNQHKVTQLSFQSVFWAHVMAGWKRADLERATRAFQSGPIIWEVRAGCGSNFCASSLSFPHAGLQHPVEPSFPGYTVECPPFPMLTTMHSPRSTIALACSSRTAQPSFSASQSWRDRASHRGLQASG